MPTVATAIVARVSRTVTACAWLVASKDQDRPLGGAWIVNPSYKTNPRHPRLTVTCRVA